MKIRNSESELELVVRQIRQFQDLVDDLYLYIKHDEGGLAPRVASLLAASATTSTRR